MNFNAKQSGFFERRGGIAIIPVRHSKISNIILDSGEMAEWSIALSWKGSER